MSLKTAELSSLQKMLGVLFIFAPLLNIYGISGVGIFDILVIFVLPILIWNCRIAYVQLIYLFALLLSFLLSTLYGGYDLSGIFQVGKFLFYIFIGISIRSYFKSYDLGDVAKLCLSIVAFGFILQLLLATLGIFESLVFSSFGLVNDHLNSTDLNLYMSKDVRFTSFFIEPAHLSVWLIFLAGILDSKNHLTKNWLLLILFLLFLCGSSFGFGFGLYLIFHCISAKYRIFAFIFVLFPSLIFLLQSDLNQLVNQITELAYYAPQISRLLENEAAVSGRTDNVDIISMTVIDILFGKGIIGTEGYMPFFVRMLNWGGISCLILIYLNFRYIIFQNKNTKDMLIVITILVCLSGILSTVNLILLFLILPDLKQESHPQDVGYYARR